jgi:acyl carrier protein
MTTKEEILAKVKLVLTGSFELPEDQVIPTAHLYKDLDLDSLDAVDLAVRLKYDTGLVLTEEEMRSMRTVADIVDMVYVKLKANEPNEK